MARSKAENTIILSHNGLTRANAYVGCIRKHALRRRQYQVVHGESVLKN